MNEQQKCRKRKNGSNVPEVEEDKDDSDKEEEEEDIQSDDHREALKACVHRVVSSTKKRLSISFELRLEDESDEAFTRMKKYCHCPSP